MRFNKDCTEKRVQHDGYKHLYETSRFLPAASKRLQKLGRRHRSLFLLAEPLTRRQIQTSAWAQQPERALHYSCGYPSQDFAMVLWCYCKDNPEQSWIQATLQPAQPGQIELPHTSPTR